MPSGISLRRTQRDRLFQLVAGKDALVELGTMKQLVVGAEIDNLTVAEDQHLVRPANLAQAVGDQDRGPVLADDTDRALDLIFSGGIDGAGGVVEDQDV